MKTNQKRIPSFLGKLNYSFLQIISKGTISKSYEETERRMRKRIIIDDSI